jgi:hypothetical protein
VTEAAAPTPLPAPTSAADIRDRLDAIWPGSPEYGALMVEYERAIEAEATAPPRTLVIPATATKGEITTTIEAARAKLLTLTEGSPQYRRLLADYETLLQHQWPESNAETLTETPAMATPKEAAKVSEILATRDAAEEYHAPTVEAEYGTVREMLGAAAADRYVAGGLQVIAAARAEIGQRGKPDALTTENLLESEWGSDAEAKWIAADLAWSRLTPRSRADLASEGVNLCPGFIRFLADVGAELFGTKAGEAFLLARHEETA